MPTIDHSMKNMKRFMPAIDASMSTMEASIANVELSQNRLANAPPHTVEHRHCEERSDAAVQ
ncbi:hypothetical protein [Candidatus Accumulibacter sp. ACC003]|uniref:hypothetical protein n=1 Tax=Candidatus Accumulibacter sp. ACC003 TaxID=2823334 RepID=UPI0025B91025|nr:hypothetical protein [Candidatus Accumulibacter sp. ACC003]